jgi:hypothetical protein
MNKKENLSVYIFIHMYMYIYTGSGIKDGVSSSSSVGIAGTARDTFEQVLVVVRENYRADKRLVREVYILACICMCMYNNR